MFFVESFLNRIVIGENVRGGVSLSRYLCVVCETGETTTKQNLTESRLVDEM